MYQSITIVGNLGKDPEQRFTPQGTAVTSFNVATSRKYTTSDGQAKEETTWFRISCWQKLAELCAEYLSKGSKVLVVGTLVPDENGNPRVWTAQDGTPKASYEIRAENVRFLSPKKQEQAEPEL